MRPPPAASGTPTSGCLDESRRVEDIHKEYELRETTVGRTDLSQANAANSYEVTRSDLPLSCPMPSMSLWNSHPKVYLPIEATGEARCPYCGAMFRLRE